MSTQPTAGALRAAKKQWKRLPRYERIKVGDRPMYADGSMSSTRVKKNQAEVGLTVASSGWFNVALKQ